MKTATKNCFLRSEPLASAEATIMKNNLPIDNPPKIRPQSAAKRPALPIYAGKGGFQAAIADVYSHRFLLDAADDVQSHHLHLVTFDKGFRRLMKPSMVTVLPTK